MSIDKDAGKLKDRLVNAEADNASHIFTNGDLRLLFEVGNTFEKALLATAVSEGWEISAFLEQDRSVIEKRLAHGAQNNEKYIFFYNTREKTGVSRFCVLNPLAIEWLGKYLALRKEEELKDKEEDEKKEKELAASAKIDQNELEAKILKEKYKDQLFPITADGVQKMLYRLAKQSGLKTTGNLRFHNIRKWLMSRLSRCGFNEFQIKYIMGKSIGVSDSTYLQTLQVEIEEKYPVVYNDYLNIVPTTLSTASKVLEKELQETKQKQANDISTLTGLITKMQATIDEQSKRYEADVAKLQATIEEQAKDVMWLKKITAVLEKPLSKEEIDEIKQSHPNDAV